jgi:4'-phosphopantetheinyl transferase EntD
VTDSRPADPAVVEHALRQLVPPGTLTGAALIDERDITELLPVELDVVRSATRARRAEFASGRVLLRRLLGTDVAIPVDGGRRPILPAGVAASLAHDRTFVVGVMTRSVRTALGIDIERVGAVESEEVAVVMRDDDAPAAADLVFTIKEAAYKAFSNAGGRMLEHHDVRVAIDGGAFTAQVLAGGALIDGRFVQVLERWLAVAALRVGPAS